MNRARVGAALAIAAAAVFGSVALLVFVSKARSGDLTAYVVIALSGLAIVACIREARRQLATTA